MPWSFRKSVNLGGGSRMTFSKSGVSVSAGGRGYRLTAGPRGTYVTLGAGGIRYRHKIGGGLGAAPAASPGYSPAPAFPPGATAPMQVFATADAAQLVDSSSAQTLEGINACISQPTYAWLLLVAGFLLALLLTHVWGWFFHLIGAATLVGVFFVHQRDVARRTYPLVYALDSAAAQDWQELVNGLGLLARCQRVWRMDAQAAVHDWKRTAGASSLVRRHLTRLATRPPALLQSNVTPYCLDIGGQRLYFLPDRIYVYQNGRYGAVEYGSLALQFGESRFIEDGGVPGDGRIVDHTWRYVNKNGGPDRRFSNNAQLPVLLYGDLVLRSPHGLQIILQVSSVDALHAAAEPLRRGTSGFHSSRTIPNPRQPQQPVALLNPNPASGPAIPRFGLWAAAVYCVLGITMMPKSSPLEPIFGRGQAVSRQQGSAQPNAASVLYNPATALPTDQPPPNLSKQQRAQWWVLHNREMRRRAAEAQQTAQARIQALEFQRKREEQLERIRAQQAEDQQSESEVGTSEPAIPPMPVVTSERLPPPAAQDSFGGPGVPAAPGGFGGVQSGGSTGGFGGAKPGGYSGGFGASASGDVHVRGYYRRDGTYVRPHTRRRSR